MRVVNVDTEEELKKAALALENKVFNDGYFPDLIVGIPTGGEKVMNSMYVEGFQTKIFIRKQRPSTNTKKKASFLPLLKYLPQFINDIIRNIEHIYHRIVFFYKKRGSGVVAKELAISQEYVRIIKKSSNVLIVDDAIDSGVTMKSVYNTIRAYNQACTIRICCINTTFISPLISPDYVLYDRVLVRYPWALDVKITDDK